MLLSTFLTDLFESGKVAVPLGGFENPLDPTDAHALLQTEEARERLRAPHNAPDYQPEAALTGATILFRACQALVDRDLSPTLLEDVLTIPDLPSDHETIYSLDLTLRFLPDLFELARARSPEDPLVRQLSEMAEKWPLSSVGIPDLETDSEAVDHLLGHPSLRQTYIDRVFKRTDISRLNHPGVREGVATAIGAFPELAPAAFRALLE
ncbi:MAG: hypothetical protein AAF514_00225 [Verrucomicrobiota bacterium]